MFDKAVGRKKPSTVGASVLSSDTVSVYFSSKMDRSMMREIFFSTKATFIRNFQISAEESPDHRKANSILL